MALSLDAVGATTEPFEFTYNWKDVVQYALGIGARADELAYLYEGFGPKVFPSFAVIPAFVPLSAAMAKSGGSLEKVVHGAQKVTLFGAIPPEGTLATTATIKGIYDLKRMAQVLITTRTTDAAGTALFETEWSILFLGEGGFGVHKPDEEREKTSPPEREPDFVVEEATSREQALLYRLSGDLNPLHADPSFPLVARFEGRPILHGLATYGFFTRAVLARAAKGDASRVKSIAARFSKPVWPGDTLRTEGWIEGAKVFARTSVKERDEVVLSHGVVHLHEEV